MQSVLAIHYFLFHFFPSSFSSHFNESDGRVSSVVQRAANKIKKTSNDVQQWAHAIRYCCVLFFFSSLSSLRPSGKMVRPCLVYGVRHTSRSVHSMVNGRMVLYVSLVSGHLPGCRALNSNHFSMYRECSTRILSMLARSAIRCADIMHLHMHRTPMTGRSTEVRTNGHNAINSERCCHALNYSRFFFFVLHTFFRTWTRRDGDGENFSFYAGSLLHLQCSAAQLPHAKIIKHNFQSQFSVFYLFFVSAFFLLVFCSFLSFRIS